MLTWGFYSDAQREWYWQVLGSAGPIAKSEAHRNLEEAVAEARRLGYVDAEGEAATQEAAEIRLV